MPSKTQKKTNQRKNKPTYKQLIAEDDGKINVLILGTSGCGKSTLVNSIMEADEADTGIGERATKKIEIYQSDTLPFRMIDTVGYEHGILGQLKIKNEIAKFCKEGVKTKDVEKLIHMIWFCIDGTAKRIEQDVLGYIKSVTGDWKNVPVIMVVTKSYSSLEIDENTEMVRSAIEKYNSRHKRNTLNVKGIVPVVSKPYLINESVSVPPSGIDQLIKKTAELTPLARSIGAESIKGLDTKIKSRTANMIITVATSAATVVGAVPMPVPDSAVLAPLQLFMMNQIAGVYEMQDNVNTNKIINKVIEVGATTLVGKKLLELLKKLPGLGVTAAILNSAVAGVVTLAAGEICNTVFQKAYLGEIDANTIDWDSEIAKMFKQYLPNILDALNTVLNTNNGTIDIKQLGKIIASLVPKKSDTSVKSAS